MPIVTELQINQLLNAWWEDSIENAIGSLPAEARHNAADLAARIMSELSIQNGLPGFQINAYPATPRHMPSYVEMIEERIGRVLDSERVLENDLRNGGHTKEVHKELASFVELVRKSFESQVVAPLKAGPEKDAYRGH